MPNYDRERPAANRTLSNVIDDDRNSLPEQLRRRRDAAQRCTPLGDGLRDPLDSYRSGRTFKPATVTTHADGPVLIVRGYGIVDVLRGARLKPIYSGASRGFLLDLQYLPDVVAHLEHAGYRVRVDEVQ